VPVIKPFRFSIQAGLPPAGHSWAELARKVEGLGYSTLTVSDHFDEQFAATPALMAAADATSVLKISSLTYCNDYRHPVVMAKEAATLDLLSDGRFEFGIGAGWMTTDYHQSGIPLDQPSIRISRLGEALDVITALWSTTPCNFGGIHYSVHDLDGLPKPMPHADAALRPGPPILIGGGGKKVLTLAARRADIIGLNIALGAGQIDEHAGPTATHESTLEKIGWIRDSAGDRFDAIEIQIRIHLAAVTNDRRSLSAALAPVLGLSADQGLSSPHALAGTVDEIIEQCLDRRERYGISYIGLSADSIDDMAPVVARLAGT